MTEIVPGLHWFRLPNVSDLAGLAFSNVYVIQGNDGFLLVDSGWKIDESMTALKKGMDEIGADVKDISQIVITHIHPDHYGLAGSVKKISGASFAMHHIEETFIDSRYIHMEVLLSQVEQMLAANGVPPNMVTTLARVAVGLERYVDPIYPDIALHDGEIITTGMFNFKVIWTPGHSSGHICLYEPDKKIFLSGDHILPTITPNISAHPQAIENPLGRYLNSLRELKRLEVKLVLPGHAKPFTTFMERIDEILQHHDQRNQEILAALVDGPRTGYQIAQKVTWGLQGSWDSLPDFHKRAAIMETLSHLEMLNASGQLDRLPGGGIIHFRRASPPR